jgi:hypothetical protein
VTLSTPRAATGTVRPELILIKLFPVSIEHVIVYVTVRYNTLQLVREAAETATLVGYLILKAEFAGMVLIVV